MKFAILHLSDIHIKNTENHVFDKVNEIINSIPGHNSKVLELENLAKGIYILNLKSDLTISKSIRLVIE